MERTILHVDVNNAFLSWTAVDMLNHGYKLDIREIPSIIGGDQDRRAGIVLAKSPVAKKFGIITGEPIYFAKKKCNSLEVFPCNFKLFIDFSNKLFEILSSYSDVIERFSIDECFIDMTNSMQGRDILSIAKEISNRVKTELGFTVNIGIAHNKLLAKMASDFEKPDKIHTLYENEIKSKMWILPVSELFMIGKKTVPKLLNMGIHTIGDLAHTDQNVLIKKFGKHGKLMYEYSNGIDSSEVITKREPPKSIGNSVTLPMDILKKDDIFDIIVALIEQVTFRLRKNNMNATVVTIQLRTSDFQDFSHQKKLPYATSSTKVILKTSKELLDEMFNNKMIRLVGVSVGGLESKDNKQFSLFEDSSSKDDKLDLVLDELKTKYGYSKVVRGSKLKVSKFVEGKENKIKD